MMMNQRRVLFAGAALVLLGLLFAGTWTYFALDARSKFDAVRREEVATASFDVVAMDESYTAFLQEVRRSWTCVHESTDGPSSQALLSLGMAPKVQRLIELLNYQVPEFSWLSAESNARASEIVTMKAVLLPASVDDTIHVSADRRMAVIQVSDSMVNVFEDTAGGLRDSLYVRPEGAGE